MSNITLGEKIRSIRKSLNLNQLEFANKLGFKSATAVSKFEDNSREPDKNNLIEIAKMGNITLDELITGNISNKYSDVDNQKINIEESIGKAYTVLSAAALNTGHALQFCQDQMKDMQSQIDVLKQQVDRLTAAPAITEGQGDGSVKKAM